MALNFSRHTIKFHNKILFDKFHAIKNQLNDNGFDRIFYESADAMNSMLWPVDSNG